ncbi:amidoligase family protein [Microvirga pudoricolor]|uniref:amidoligase family protein n=1 Tax=Microvirga pudoricolor TaxID=2778729 RepID=UPI00194F5DD2|nr:amidoligase family protein [Microvirga pudoricolor]MBM6592514.1 amidoligase family protein [Microvirga pudoricolor]
MRIDAAVDADILSSEDLIPPGFPLMTVDGRPRRVGVEIEFMGPSARVAADALARVFGGTRHAEDPHAYRVEARGIGSLRVETDLRHVHPQRHRNLGLTLPPRVAAWLGTMVAPVVPRELVLNPLPMDQLEPVDQVVRALQEAGARGRGAMLWDTLGLHFNIDPPELDAQTLVRYFKAFLLLEDELRDATAGRSVRLGLLLPPRYPATYRRRVLDPDYWPDIQGFTNDYLLANPTRKRSLDLLPLLAHLDGDRVRSVLPHEKIGPRPVFHYRLPVAHLGRPGWNMLPDWQRWLHVERLAMDRDRLVESNASASKRSDLPARA